MSNMTLIDRKKLTLRVGKVVKSADYSQLTEASDCVKQAQAYAEEIRTSINEEVAQAQADGYNAGIAKAQEEFSCRMAATVMRLESAHLGLEARLVNTVMRSLNTVLGSLDDAVILEKLVRQCIHAAGQEKRLSLRVSAEQFDAANLILQSILSEYKHIECIDILKDPNLHTNSCVLETEYGAIDGSLDMHLIAIRQGLIDAFAGRRPLEKAKQLVSSDAVEQALC